jgi:hypothetical protein
MSWAAPNCFDCHSPRADVTESWPLAGPALSLHLGRIGRLNLSRPQIFTETGRPSARDVRGARRE